MKYLKTSGTLQSHYQLFLGVWMIFLNGAFFPILLGHVYGKVDSDELRQWGMVVQYDLGYSDLGVSTTHISSFYPRQGNVFISCRPTLTSSNLDLCRIIC